MHRALLFWIVAGLVAAGVLGAGLIARNPRPAENPACAGGAYGSDYATCVQCIGAESYCASVFGAPGEEPPTPTPTATGQELGGDPERPAICRTESYGVDYATCVQCIHSEPYCATIWGRPRGSSTDGGQRATPAPTPTPTPNVKATPTPASTPTPTPPPGPTATPTPTPQVDCAGGYGHTYEECVQCIGNVNYCSNLFL